MGAVSLEYNRRFRVSCVMIIYNKNQFLCWLMVYRHHFVIKNHFIAERLIS